MELKRVFTMLNALPSMQEYEENNHLLLYYDKHSQIMCSSEKLANAMADVLVALDFADIHTYYYDPDEDTRDGVVDEYTGMWAVYWD